MDTAIRRFSNLSIRVKLTALIVLTATAGLLVTTPAFIVYTYRSLHAEAARDLTTTAHALAANSTAALTFGDRQAASELLTALRAKPAVTGACLLRDDERGKRVAFAGFSPDPTGVDPCTAPVNADGTLSARAPVMLDGQEIGALSISLSLADVRQSIQRQSLFALAMFTLSMAMSLVIAMRAQRTITGPILQLAATARKIAETHDYTLRVPIGSGDELGRLAGDFNQMLMQIGKADAELQASRKALTDEVAQTITANSKLALTLDDLRRTQAQLVQSEKMASLGALVAGVAHEINTPVGVGVTAASTLAARTSQFKDLYESQQLKRTDLDRFVQIAHESSDILLKNLQRAADLISSFKRVAVDQSSDQRRRFDLKAYIDETLRSLAPKYRKLGHTVNVDCADGIEIDSYPGAFAQILTNFVSNSLMHAFEPGAAGSIDIDAHLDGNDVVLRYRDHGKGIPAEHLPQIFDPFFTTKRGAGGSGLGLHIVFNLASQQLGGRVTASSPPGQGAEFVLRFPRVAAKSAAPTVSRSTA